MAQWRVVRLRVLREKRKKKLERMFEVRYNIYIEARYIEPKYTEQFMEERLRRIYLPMTETGFYILFCLQEEMHGYSIGKKVSDMTGGEITISPGTMYGTLSKMEKDGLISFVREEEKRRLYRITELGREILAMEMKRIERLYKNSIGEPYEQ